MPRKHPRPQARKHRARAAKKPEARRPVPMTYSPGLAGLSLAAAAASIMRLQKDTADA